MHQHGPLFNYGPYYGYYPFKPYGPWDAYLRYDPFFYGDPYANWHKREQQGDTGNMYGRNQNLPEKGWLKGHGGHGLGVHGFGAHGFGFTHGCLTCGFWHASWLHGGWFKGHAWLTPHWPGLFHKSCSSCGGVAVATPIKPTGDATARFDTPGFREPGAVRGVLHRHPDARPDAGLAAGRRAGHDNPTRWRTVATRTTSEPVTDDRTLGALAWRCIEKPRVRTS